MKNENLYENDFGLFIVRDEKSGGFCAWIEGVNTISQGETIEESLADLCRSLRDLTVTKDKP